MPDYFPQIQLPTGLVEETARMQAQKGQNSPWVALAQAIGQASQGYSQGVQKRQEFLGPQTTQQEQQAYGVAPGSRDLASKYLTAKEATSRQEKVASDKAGYAKELEDLKSKHAQELAGLRAQMGQIDGPTVENIHKWVSSQGKEGLPLDTFPAFGGGRAKAIQALQKKYPGDNVALAEMGYAAGKAEATSAARAPNSPQMFKIRALANSLLPQLDMLSQASDAVARGDIKTINSLSGKMHEEFSDKDWSNLKKRAAMTADEFQAQIGAGSDQKLDLAKQLIDTSDSPKVLKNAIEIMSEAVKSRAIASTGKTPTTEDITGDSKKTGKDSPPKSKYDDVINKVMGGE